MTLKIDTKFEKNPFIVSKMTRIWWIFIQALKVSKICTLMGLFRAKYIMFDLKKYEGIILHDTGESCKIWRKINLWFGEWHKEFGKFSPQHLEVSKSGLWWDSFFQSRKRMS